MKPLNPVTPRLMAAAAELLAGGSWWEKIAGTLHCDEAACRAWIEENPKLWRRLMIRAEERQEHEARAEARVHLRNLLRTSDDKQRLAAAQVLLKKESRRRASRKDTKTSGEDEALAMYVTILRGKTNDELDDESRAIDSEAGRHNGEALSIGANRTE